MATKNRQTKQTKTIFKMAKWSAKYDKTLNPYHTMDTNRERLCLAVNQEQTDRDEDDIGIHCFNTILNSCISFFLKTFFNCLNFWRMNVAQSLNQLQWSYNYSPKIFSIFFFNNSSSSVIRNEFSYTLN